MIQIRQIVVTRFMDAGNEDNNNKMIDILGDALSVLSEGCNDTSITYLSSILQIESYSLADEPQYRLEALERAQSEEGLQDVLRGLGVDTATDPEAEIIDGVGVTHVPDQTRFIDHVSLSTCGETYDGVAVPKHVVAPNKSRSCTLKAVPRRGPQTVETLARLWVAHIFRWYVIPNLAKVSATASHMHAVGNVLIRTSNKDVVKRATELMKTAVQKLGGFQSDWPRTFHSENWNDWGLKTDSPGEHAALWRFGFGMTT